MQNTKRAGAGLKIFFIVFGLPFFAVGLFVLHKALFGEVLENESFPLLFVFGTVFASVGLGLGLMGHWLSVRANAEEDLRAKFPLSPWKWEPNWASGKVPCDSKGSFIALFIFAFFWCALSSPLVFFLPEELQKGNYAALFGLIFPLVGILLLTAAVKAWVRWRKFGTSVFELLGETGVIGGDLRGNLLLAPTVAPNGDMLVSLTCVERTTSGSGKSRSTTERTLWEAKEKRSVLKGSLYGGIPIAFTIPFECEPTSRDTNPSIGWTLSVSVPTSGVDLEARFSVPVFKNASSREELTSESLRAQTISNLREPPKVDTKIQMFDGPDGREYRFLERRNLSTILVLAVFWLLGTGACILFYSNIPTIFVVIFALLELLFLFVILFLLGHATRVVVSRTGIVAIHSLFGFHWSHAFSAVNIARISVEPGMQYQRGSASTVFYDIKIYTKERPDLGVPIARAINSKEEAEWLAEDMKGRMT